MKAKLNNIRRTTVKYFTSAEYRLLLNYRIGKKYNNKPGYFNLLIVKYFRYRQITKRNCQISYKAEINPDIKFPHPIGIVIGDYVKIGSNVKIWQQVTLGSHGKSTEKLKYPIVEDNVKIFAGAKILGGITIGKNAIIGANAVVIKDVPADAIAVGVPAKIIFKNRQSESNENI